MRFCNRTFGFAGGRATWTAVAMLAVWVATFVTAHATARSGVIDSVEALEASLTTQNAGRRILLRSATYVLNAPLRVPDGVTLSGEGVMLGQPYPRTTSFPP